MAFTISWLNISSTYGWLVKRLSKSRQRSPRWVALAESVEELFEAEFYPQHDSMLAVRSIYTADADGLLKIVADLGGYYEPALNEANVQIAIAMRKVEIHQKETSIPMERVLLRMGMVGVKWEPLYYIGDDPWFAPGATYGTNGCFTRQELLGYGIDVDNPGATDVMLTSRLVVEIDNPNELDEEVINTAVREGIKVIKPLRIVFDGIRLNPILIMVMTDFFTTFNSQYSLYYPMSGAILKGGDSYSDHAGSSPGAMMITDGPITPVYIGFGNGGHTGTDPNPENTALTELVSELLRVPIVNRALDAAGFLVCVGLLNQGVLVGETISEIGIYDADHRLIALVNIAPRLRTSDSYYSFKCRLPV
jgi:hypothetical protein